MAVPFRHVHNYTCANALKQQLSACLVGYSYLYVACVVDLVSQIPLSVTADKTKNQGNGWIATGSMIKSPYYIRNCKLLNVIKEDLRLPSSVVISNADLMGRGVKVLRARHL